MKQYLLISAAVLVLTTTSVPLLANDLLLEDFGSYTFDSNLSTSGPWSTVNGGSVNIVRDDFTDTPFGTTNQYLELIDPDGTASSRIQSPNIGAASGTITTFSFDFYEPSDGGASDLLFGYSEAGADLNTAGSYLRFGLKDGTISSKESGGFSTTGTNTYSLDTSYTLYAVLNDSASDVTSYFDGRTLAAGTADVWLDPLGADMPVFVGTTAPGGTQTASYRVGFRTFTGAIQSMLIDNVCLESGIGGPMSTALPPTIPPAGQPQSQTVVAGTGLIYLVVDPSGDEPFTYQWKLGGTNIPGATDRTLSIDNPDAGDAGDYTVVVTNAVDTVTSDPATVTLGSAASSLVENFDSYTPDFLENAVSDWAVNINGYYEVVDGGGGDNYLGCLDDDGAGTAPSLKPLGANEIANGDTSTFFSRVYRDSTADGSLWFGLTDSLTGGYNAFEGYVTFSANGNIGIRDGGAAVNATTKTTADSWHNIWVVHNNARDTVQVFMTTDDRDATLADRLESSSGQVEFGFRNGTGNPITYVQTINRNTVGPWRVDDFYMSPSANLVYPVTVPTELGPITIEVQNGDAVLTWPGAGVLQSNGTLQGTWTDVAGGAATSPYTITGPLSSGDYFRLRN